MVENVALTCWCKKCRKDVAIGEMCPECGGKLGKTTIRSAWCISHTPAADWMKWNEIMRILLPVWLVVFSLIFIIEAAIGGREGIALLMTSGMVGTMVLLLLLSLVLVLLVLLFRGDDLLDCVCDSKGIHVQTWLKNPTSLQLLLRLKSPGLRYEAEENGGLVFTGQQEILWKDIRRIQCWNEKTTVIFYGAPVWWSRLSLPCTPFTYEDVLRLSRDKLGKKKNVTLDAEILLAREITLDGEYQGQIEMNFERNNVYAEEGAEGEEGIFGEIPEDMP